MKDSFAWALDTTTDASPANQAHPTFYDLFTLEDCVCFPRDGTIIRDIAHKFK